MQSMSKSTVFIRLEALNRVAGSLAAALLVSGLAAPANALAQTQAAAPSLYQRVGGYDLIARFVDTAFPRVASHPQLRRMFQGHSVDSQMRQRQLIVDALCKEMGGPRLYLGRPMKPLHEGLRITDSDWSVFMGIIGGALVELKVPERERGDWIALFERTCRPGVVEAPET
jgi:hemoglobin